MRQPGSRQPVASFEIPPGPPAAVVEAKERFDAAATAWAAASEEVRDAEEAVKVAATADVRAIADAAAQGKKIADPDKREREARTKIRPLLTRAKGLEVALDEAGNALAWAIAESRAEWLSTLDADAAARDYEAAITAARQALDTLRATRGAAIWLETFDNGDARHGASTQFAGGRLFVTSRDRAMRGVFDPSKLLELAALAANPPQPPKAEAEPEPDQTKAAA